MKENCTLQNYHIKLLFIMLIKYLHTQPSIDKSLQ